MSGVDLYPDVSGAIRDLKKLRGEHPYESYLRLGPSLPSFKLADVLSDPE